MDVSQSGPLLGSSPVLLPADPTLTVGEPIPEQVAENTLEWICRSLPRCSVLIRVPSVFLQMPVDAVSMAAPVAPPPVSADFTPVLTQTVSGDAAPVAADVFQAVVSEPRLSELGLAAHTPVGLIQNLLEFMHIDLGLPWWGAIVVGKSCR